MRILAMCLMLMLARNVSATVLHVGAGRPYANPATASRMAVAGDTILIHAGTYLGTFWIEDLNGSPGLPIVIRGEDRSTVVFDGGSESMHMSKCSYVQLENFTVTRQTGNGMNIDDGGVLDTPTHHIVVRNVLFTQMAATGNNDQLKLSGLDTFSIEDCTFEDGAVGGSGVDMVGCHKGLFKGNTFTRQGSNCIQAKGGTQHIRIEGNRFIDGGQRAVNLGGSTGLQFFRPPNATFEAADLQVYSNLFVRSVAPISFVGCVRVHVENNTIINPVRWVFRVLQETVDTSRFLPCGDNYFRNNIIVYTTSISTHVNIGSNTAPESFTLANNLWYKSDDVSRSQPNLVSMSETASIYGSDPQFIGATTDQRLQQASPAIGKGIPIDSLTQDMQGQPYATPPSIGAYEGASTTRVDESNLSPKRVVRLSATEVSVTLPVGSGTRIYIVYDLRGRAIGTGKLTEGTHRLAVGVAEFVVVK